MTAHTIHTEACLWRLSAVCWRPILFCLVGARPTCLLGAHTACCWRLMLLVCWRLPARGSYYDCTVHLSCRVVHAFLYLSSGGLSVLLVCWRLSAGGPKWRLVYYWRLVPLVRWRLILLSVGGSYHFPPRSCRVVHAFSTFPPPSSPLEPSLRPAPLTP
jgi:hypothetical protein